MTFKLNKKLAVKVLKVVDAGLCSGVGSPIPGQMCVEAAVCYAMGLPHGDQPTCVSSAVRGLKIQLNDANWSSNTARAKGMRRLAIAQLGTMDIIDDKQFAKLVSTISITKVVPRALRHAASIHPDKIHKEALENAALLCEKEGTESAARSAAWSAARSAAESAAESAAWSARSAAELAAWSAAELAARSAAESAAWSAESAARSAAESAARSAAESAAESAADIELSLFAEEVVQILIKLKAPGAKYLNLTEKE